MNKKKLCVRPPSRPMSIRVFRYPPSPTIVLVSSSRTQSYKSYKIFYVFLKCLAGAFITHVSIFPIRKQSSLLHLFSVILQYFEFYRIDIWRTGKKLDRCETGIRTVALPFQKNIKFPN